MSFIAVIGWARRLTRIGGLRASGLVFVLLWLAALLAGRVERFDVHGPSVFLYCFVLPVASLLSIILFFMGVASNQSKTPTQPPLSDDHFQKPLRP